MRKFICEGVVRCGTHEHLTVASCNRYVQRRRELIGCVVGTRTGDPRERTERRQRQGPAALRFGIDERREIPAAQTVEQVVVGMMRLQPHLAASLSVTCVAHPTGGVHDEFESRFGGAKARCEQLPVDVEQHDDVGILDAVENGLGLDGDALDGSRAVLNDFGNMSSATLMFVLSRLLRERGRSDAPRSGLAMAFGPGLAAESFRFTLTGRDD